MQKKPIEKSKGIVMLKAGRCQYQNLFFPSLSSEFVKINVHSTIINPADWYLLSGEFQLNKDIPSFLGCEGSGIVVEAGSNAEYW